MSLIKKKKNINEKISIKRKIRNHMNDSIDINFYLISLLVVFVRLLGRVQSHLFQQKVLQLDTSA